MLSIFVCFLYFPFVLDIFNMEIYSMPGSRGDPYMLFGSKMPSLSSSDQPQPGFERLLPQIEQLPKLGTVQVYALQSFL